MTESDDAFTSPLKVTNTGKTYSGKGDRQVYFQSPYTDYDKANGIEKAAAELCGFAKTDVGSPAGPEGCDHHREERQLFAHLRRKQPPRPTFRCR